jgi:TPR repeat protein
MMNRRQRPKRSAANYVLELLVFLSFFIFPSRASHLGRLGYFKNVYNKHPQPGELVEDDRHNVWYIQTSGVKRPVPAWKIVLQKFPEKAMHILRVDDATLRKFKNGTRIVYSDQTTEGYPLLSQTVPFNRDFRIQAQSPLNFGIPGTIVFFVWLWDGPQMGSPHLSLLQAIPLQRESLSPILYALPSDPGKISLFLGLCTTERKGTMAGAKVNLDIKGVTMSNVMRPRKWHHVALVYTGEILSLLIDNHAVGELNTTEFNLQGQAGGQGAIDPARRVLTFGKVESAKGITGLISHARAWDGVALLHQQIKLNIARSAPAPIPKWLVKVVQASLGDDPLNKLSDEKALSTTQGAPPPEEDESASASMFKFGQALVAAPPSEKMAGGDWRQRALGMGILAVQKSRTRMEDALKSWNKLSERELLDEAFKSRPCIMTRLGWWDYQLCHKSGVSQSHAPQNPNEVLVNNTIGVFESAGEPVFLVDPSLLHKKCNPERQIFCPHISFESAKAMVGCLYDSRAQAGMGRKCASTVKGLKFQSSVIAHRYRNGDDCSPSNAPRMADVSFVCCSEFSVGAPLIKQVVETRTCVYHVKVCVPLLCPPSFPDVQDILNAEGPGPLPLPIKSANRATEISQPAAAVESSQSHGDKNFFHGAEVEESSFWNPTNRGRFAVDGNPDTLWKSGVNDNYPEITISPKTPCESGVNFIRLHWKLAPDGFTIFASSLTGDYFEEISSVASSALQGRIDTLEGWPMSHPSKLQKIKLRIDRKGPFTAVSLIDVWGRCGSDDIAKAPAVFNAISAEVTIEANGAQAGVSESNANVVKKSRSGGGGLIHWTTSNESLALKRIGSGIRDSKMAHMVWMLHFMHLPKMNRKNYNYEKLSFEKSRHTLAYNFLRGNSWPMLERQNVGAPDGSVVTAKRDEGLRNPLAERQHQEQFSFSPDEDISAAIYYDAALEVVGPEKKQKHPKPAERIYLSKASKELLKQHDGDDSDVAVFQKDRAEQGDLNAKMWIAGRYYHGLNGFPQDRPRAAEAFRAAAEVGNAEGAYNYAVMRYNGQDGRPADPVDAHRYFQIAAEKEFSPALNGIGVQHMGKKEYQKAAEYFKRSAATLSPDGHFNLGSLYKDGKGLKQNYRMAVLHFLIASHLGHHRAMFQLGEAYLHRRSWITFAVQEEMGQNRYTAKPSKILAMDSWAGKDGNVNMTGYVYDDRIVLSMVQKTPKLIKNSTYPLNRSSSMAIKFLRPLAELGVAQNVTKEALKLWNEGDFRNAELLYEEAATMGMVDAISNVAWIQRGKRNMLNVGGIKNLTSLISNASNTTEEWKRELFALYRASQAAMEGNVDDILLLGSAYELSGKDGVERAMEYFEYAASKNSQEGLFRVGFAYLITDLSVHGRFSRNDSKAEEHFRRSVELGGYEQIPSLVGLAVLRLRQCTEKIFNRPFNNFEEFEHHVLPAGALQYAVFPTLALGLFFFWVYLSWKI